MVSQHEDQLEDQSASLPVEQQAAEQPTRRRGAAVGNQYAKGYGAPKGNRNRMTHGQAGWLATGSLPKGASYVRRLIGRMRSVLERAVLDSFGEVGPTEAALIQSACRHEGRALLAQRWLREGTDLPVKDRLAMLQVIGNATDSRDRAIEKLKLTPLSQRDPWAALTVPGRVIDEQEPARDTLDAPDDPSVMEGHDLAPDAASGDEEVQS